MRIEVFQDFHTSAPVVLQNLLAIIFLFAQIGTILIGYKEGFIQIEFFPIVVLVLFL